MNDLSSYLWICLGVVLAVLWPLLKAKMKQFFQIGGSNVIAEWLKKYALLLIFAGVAGLLLFAYWRSQHPKDALQWYTALLLGFSWESTFEKLVTTPKAPPTFP